MMFRKAVVALFLGFMLFSPALQAADLKFGVVNIQEVLDNVEQGRKAKGEMEKTILDRKKELDNKQKEFKGLEDSYEKQKLILSPDALDEKRKQLESKKEELQRFYLNAQQDMQKKELQLTGDILKRIKSVVEKIGQQEKFNFIWEKNEGGLVYFQGASDLTQQVINEFNKTFK